MAKKPNILESISGHQHQINIINHTSPFLSVDGRPLVTLESLQRELCTKDEVIQAKNEHIKLLHDFIKKLKADITRLRKTKNTS